MKSGQAVAALAVAGLGLQSFLPAGLHLELALAVNSMMMVPIAAAVAFKGRYSLNQRYDRHHSSSLTANKSASVFHVVLLSALQRLNEVRSHGRTLLFMTVEVVGV
jgi:hypothetical protein